MKKDILFISLLLILSVTFFGCDPQKSDQDHSNHEGHNHEHEKEEPKSGHHHEGEKSDLGKVTIGTWEAKIVQIGKVTAGKESVFELELTGKDEVSAVRAWIGTADAKGSRKAKADAEANGHYHFHVSAPKEIPIDSKLWISVEDNTGKKTTAEAAYK